MIDLFSRVLKRETSNKGFTLLEVIAVIVILGIIAIISVPNVLATIEKTKTRVCHVNQQQVSKEYKEKLLLEDFSHSEATFTTFLREVKVTLCPENGIFTFLDGKVVCNIHTDEHDQHVEKEEEVPYL